MPANKEDPSQDKEKKPLIVGLGASAGGLEALKTFFQSLPEDTGMAFIVVVHLAPDHKSSMAQLLQIETSLNVQQVNKRVNIEPEHVYVIPPNKLLKVGDNHLELSEPDKKHGLATIDLFFRSLAKAKKDHAACIVLSGTGSDGTLGMKAIKEEGGLTIVQDPEEAHYPSMPQSAIAGGLADLVLPAAKIAKELTDYNKSLPEITIEEDEDKRDDKVLEQIFEQVRNVTDHDFSNYKSASVLRRIKRRMQVNRVTKLPDYLSYLKENADEPEALFKDLLISVTNFFRDPEAFKALKKQVIPKLFENKTADEQVRVWVPGCATGEEAYSVAILLQEHARQIDRPPEVKVFGTDIDEEALTTARQGRYPQSIEADVSSQRLTRYFDKKGSEYEVKQEIRDLILFASHDLLRDPPFSKLDMVACRNLLIYLNRELQSEVFNLFHYTLKEEGHLFLGLSDSNLEASDLFSSIDKKNRLYRRISTSESNRKLPEAPLQFSRTLNSGTDLMKRKPSKKSNYETLHRTLLARMYAPQSVITNENFHVLHATDGIKKFLEYSGGEPSHDILEMVTSEIRQPLRSLLFQIEKKEPRTLRKKVHLLRESSPDYIEIIVHPIHEKTFSDGLIQIVFKEIKNPSKKRDQAAAKNKKEVEEQDHNIIKGLEDELEYTKEQLQITVEEYETSNEELRASNEELQSMNEELQSTTEELETSQEELQSVNEELKTVNKELENKVEELDRANSDLKNLMEASEIGIIFVDRDYCVKRFTSTATNIFNLIPSDKGRPLDHVTHNLEYPSILEDIKEVHKNLKNIKKVVYSKDGRWYIMRMQPYRSIEDKIEGVILTFVEFTELKEAREMIHEQNYQESLAALGVYALDRNDLTAIMQRAIDLSCVVMNLDCAVILALNEEKNEFKMGAHAGCADEDQLISVDDKWDIGYAIAQKKPTMVVDYKDDERFSVSPFLEDKNIVSSVHIVVRSTDNVYGLLGFYTYEKREFVTHEINYLQVVANIVGQAIERTYAQEALEKEVEQSRQYQREILNNSVTERWELGSYLHDNFAQTLASAKIRVVDIENKLSESGSKTPKELAEISKIIDVSIRDIRSLIGDIIPIDIEEEGVAHALRLLMRQSQKLHKIKCTLEAQDIINDIKNIEIATNLYHVVQEAIKNAALHGEADHIKVSFKKSDGDLILRIEDDGIGLSHSSNENNGRGLRIMKYRMELLGGTFEIKERSEAGKTGTIVICTQPMEDLTARDDRGSEASA